MNYEKVAQKDGKLWYYVDGGGTHTDDPYGIDDFVMAEWYYQKRQQQKAQEKYEKVIVVLEGDEDE